MAASSIPINAKNKIVQRVVSGTFEFHADLPVSKMSRFADTLWSWVDSSDQRLACYCPGRLKIDWQKIIKRYGIPITILSDIKRYAFLRYCYAREVLRVGRGKRNAHPSTIVNDVEVLTRFLSVVCGQATVGKQPLIRHLSDILVEDLEAALSNSRHPHHPLRNILKDLALPGMAKLLEYGPPGWNCNDLKTLPWKVTPRVPYERLPEPLFQFLSATATADVKQFLEAMNIEPEDKINVSRPNIFLSEFSSFRELFEDYVEMRSEHQQGPVKEWRSYTMWCRKHGHMIQVFSDLINRARLAAELIVAMYTGARLSELNSFTTKSLVRDGEVWILKGTEIKRRSRLAPTFRDKWVAIPIVRDAVKLLTQTGSLVNSTHLFHHRKSGNKRRRVGSGVHKKHLALYLRTVDVEGKWIGTTLHSLRFRHSLVYELRKAGLGLPYITFQLKHYYDSLNRHPNNVTVMYGNLAGTATEKAVEDANRKFVEQIYHPDALVTGGGAELHKKRRAAYFSGMAIRGLNQEDVIKALAKRGMPMTDVGTALCTGQRTIVLDGVKKDPPCIGQLRCNPILCSNAIIPEYKQQAWRRVAIENRRRATDPEYSHASSHFEEAAAEAEEVVRFFQIRGRRKHE